MNHKTLERGSGQRMLPAGWAEAPLSDVSEINPGVDLNGLPADAEVSFIPMAAVEERSGRLDASRHRRLAEVRSGYTRFRNGDVLFAKITPCMENGKVAIARDLLNGLGCGSTEFHIVRPERGVSPKYLLYFLLQDAFRQRAERNMKGTAGQRRVPSEYVGAASIAIAPSSQQDRIVAKIEELFSRIDAGVDNLTRAQALLRRYRQAALKAAVTGELTRDWRARNAGRSETGADLLKRILQARRKSWEAAELAKMKARDKPPKDDRWKARYVEPAPPDNRDLDALPEGWAWATVGQLAEVSGGITKNPKRNELRTKRPYLRVANVYADRLSLEDVFEIGVTNTDIARAELIAGDLLIVEGNGSIDQVGRVALWDGSIPGCVHQNHIIKARLLEYAITPFSLIWFMSPDGRSTIRRVASSTSGLHTLSLSKVEALPIPLPGLEEIGETLRRHDECLSRMAHIEASISPELIRAGRLRQAILRAAFSGELVPQDPTDEPASALLDRIRAERAAGGNGAKSARRVRRRAVP